jgi:UbiD family decarboxylase
VNTAKHTTQRRFSEHSSLRDQSTAFERKQENIVSKTEPAVGTYTDVRQYLDELERRDLLVRVDRKMNKDTEIMPLVRWQFRGLDQAKRKGWLFTNVTDSRGRDFDGSVAVAILGASPTVYAAAMGLDSPDGIAGKWALAQQSPIEPREVDTADAPVKEVKILGDEVVSSGGLDAFPVTITNPGSDASAYFSAPVWITKDPETGVYNAGTYRAMVKAADRIGCSIISGQDARVHWQKARAMGVPLEAVLILSPPPALSLCSVQKLDISEYNAAGAINGAPMELVKAETVDLLIPAAAEIAIEGKFRTDVLEREGPFGEFGGYVGSQDYQLIFEVSAITHRKSPVLQAFISEMPPSESSCMRKLGFEGFQFAELRAKVPNLKKVTYFEMGGSAQSLAITLHEPEPGEAWEALRAAASTRNMPMNKWIIAIDDDIDAEDLDSLMWAISWRVQPHHDVQIQRGRYTDLDPSGAPVDDPFNERTYPDGLGGSQILVDATRSWAYPPVSLPSKDLMENAQKIWEELKLPELTPRVPWHGYDLGYLPDNWKEEAKRAVDGEYLKTGEEFLKYRTKSSYFETGVVVPPGEDPS